MSISSTPSLSCVPLSIFHCKGLIRATKIHHTIVLSLYIETLDFSGALQLIEKAKRVEYAQFIDGQNPRWQERWSQKMHSRHLQKIMDEHIPGDMEAIRKFLRHAKHHAPSVHTPDALLGKIFVHDSNMRVLLYSVNCIKWYNFAIFELIAKQNNGAGAVDAHLPHDDVAANAPNHADVPNEADAPNDVEVEVVEVQPYDSSSPHNFTSLGKTDNFSPIKPILVPYGT